MLPHDLIGNLVFLAARWAVVLSYGFGLALWWRIGAGAAMAIAVAIIVVQIPLSAWWLSRFTFGPIEWLWRRLTYGRPLALRA